MKLDKIRNMSQTELAAEELKLKKELFNLRFQHVTGQLENPIRIREVKRTYARVRTILTERAAQKA